jgi:hypothetical protein
MAQTTLIFVNRVNGSLYRAAQLMHGIGGVAVCTVIVAPRRCPMPVGGGKFDRVAETVFKEEGVLLMVIGGKLGGGVSVFIDKLTPVIAHGQENQRPPEIHDHRGSRRGVLGASIRVHKPRGLEAQVRSLDAAGINRSAPLRAGGGGKAPESPRAVHHDRLCPRGGTLNAVVR